MTPHMLFAESQGKSFEEIAATWRQNNAGAMEAAALSFDDMLRGGICNVSRHTALPAALLRDLAYDRAEEADFFGPVLTRGRRSDFASSQEAIGQLGDDFYAVDPCFVRDSGYRALLWNLLQRSPNMRRRSIHARKS